MANLIPVAIWIRVSTDESAFGSSAQHTANVKTCGQLGLEAVRKFQIEDVSGKDVMLTPEAQQLIALMESGIIKGVVVAQFSRIARPDDLSAFELLAKMQRNRCTLYLPNGPLDLRDKMGVFMATILGGVAGFERNTIKEQTMKGKEEARVAGHFTGGSLPYGVSFEKKVGWRYTDAAARVIECFERVKGGELNTSALARLLGMSITGVGRVLRNPIYTGWLIYEHEVIARPAGKDGRQGGSIRVKRDPSKVIRCKVFDEPLVSQQTFDRVQRILDMRLSAHRRETKRGWANYNGFTFCHRCGALLSPWRDRKAGRGYYRCMNRLRKQGCDAPWIPAAALESRVDRLLTQELTSHAFLNRIEMQLQNSNRDARRGERLERLESEARSLEAKRQRTLDLFTDGDIKKAEKDARLAKLQERSRSVEADLARERESILPGATLDQLVAMVKPFQMWHRLLREERRQLLTATIPRFRIDGERIVSFYRLLDSAEIVAPAALDTRNNKETAPRRLGMS